MLPIDLWLLTPQGLKTDIPPQDSYSHEAVQSLALIINELANGPSLSRSGLLSKFWKDCQTWVVEAPQCVRPVVEVEACGESVFPTILFSNPSAGEQERHHLCIPSNILPAVCGNVYYHAACILLLEMGKVPDNFSAMVKYLHPFTS